MAFRRKIPITIFIVVGFDAIASVLSRSFQFDYTRLIWVSLLIYFAVGYWGAHRRGVRYGMLLGALAGLADSTIGWAISRMIGPFIETATPPLDPTVILTVVVTVTMTGFVLGLIGAGLCKVFGQTKLLAA